MTRACFPITHAFFVLLIGMMLYASPSYALSYTSGGTTVQCNTAADTSMVVKVVYCVKMAVFSTTEDFLTETSALMLPIVNAVILLSIVLLGVRLATGERDPQKMVMALLLKAGVVWLFVDNMGAGGFAGGLTENIFRAIEQMQAMAATALYDGGTCEYDTSSAPTGSYIDPASYEPWAYIDCILDYVFGFGISATIASSIFGFIASAFFSGTMGAMVFFLGLSVVLSLALFAFRTVYIVLVSYVYVGFLIVLAPLVFPMLMFKITEQTFFKWLWNLVGGIFMPLTMIAYLAFAMPLLDTFVLGDDEQSLRSTFGEGSEVTDRYRNTLPLVQGTMPTEFDYFDGLPVDDIVQNPLDSTKTGAMDVGSWLDFSQVDLGEEQVQEFLKIGMSLLRVLAVTYLILTIAKFIPELNARIVGGGFSLSSGAMQPMLFETAIRGGLRNMNGLVSGSGTGLMRNGIPGIR
jgi:TrbL/VirB6 plasmid conjugal transfer protein